MDAKTSYARYVRHCGKHRIAPQGFTHFVREVFPFTLF